MTKISEYYKKTIEWSYVIRKKPNKWLAAAIIAIVIIAVLGNIRAFTMIEKLPLEESFEFEKGLNVKITVVPPNRYGNFPLLGEDIVFKVEIVNTSNDAYEIEYRSMVNYTQTAVFYGETKTGKIQPNDKWQFSIAFPLVTEGNNRLVHDFVYKKDSQVEKLHSSVHFDRIAVTMDQYLTITNYAIIYQYAWIISIPLVLSSIKILRDIFEEK